MPYENEAARREFCKRRKQALRFDFRNASRAETSLTFALHRI